MHKIYSQLKGIVFSKFIGYRFIKELYSNFPCNIYEQGEGFGCGIGNGLIKDCGNGDQSSEWIELETLSLDEGIDDV